ncbi:MAG: hypothetical protein WBA93_11650 [Microcoleaceae cyanobacterium]
MGLKHKKGFNIVTKSHKAKLLRDEINFGETKLFFNSVVEFYFGLVDKHPEGTDVAVNKGGGWRFYEVLTIGEDPKYFIPESLNKCPSTLRRAAIRIAIGAWKSWHSNYTRWQHRAKKYKHHRPPVQPRQFNFSLPYDKGMSKNDDGVNQTIMLKLLINGQWKWLKFNYQQYSIDNGWVKGQITIVIKRNQPYLTYTLEKYVPATGGSKKVMADHCVRVMAVDIDLDKHAAIVSILETEANQVREVARHFIKTPVGVQLRKRDLGTIAQKMRLTGIIDKGFCSSLWSRLSRREIEMGRTIGRQLAELAHGYNCQLMAFEHLENLKPIKGKYSRKSNQKRSYWLKSKIFDHASRVAYTDYTILTNRVNPRDTSRVDPWGNLVARQNNLVDWTDDAYNPGATWVIGQNDYISHSGINAARNIGLKAIARYRTNPVFIWEQGKA